MISILIFLAILLVILIAVCFIITFGFIYLIWTTDYTYCGKGLKWDNKLKTYGPGR